VSGVAVAVSLAAALRHGEGWYQRYWPDEAVAAVASRPTATPVFPSDRSADWLLWRIPTLRGRIAYDVRFEVLDRSGIDALLAYSRMDGPTWYAVTDGYGVVVLDLPRRRDQLRALTRDRGFTVLYEKKNDIAVLAAPNRPVTPAG
jgi:hypothetical protein